MTDSVTQSLSSLTLGGQVADPALLDEADQFKPGDLVGPYRIVRLAGAGGMGVVYLAEQLSPVQRRLALKFVRRKGMGDLADAYFLVERQALAQLDHPGIAVLYDAGRIGGLLYFAMEWVEGAPIDEYIAEHQPDRKARLRLFVRACRAMHHAHTRGIIHRDLKPENILVEQIDERPAPKIIDFGIALLAEHGEEGGKRVRDRAGTRAYMSPEQAEKGAEIDIRSDVYALGVVLYKLLCEEPEPSEADAELSGRDLYELLGPRGSTTGSGQNQGAGGLAVRRGALPKELRCVIAKAVAPDRQDRYDSALALAADLERYLDGYPLEAVRAGSRYRLGKFVRRHAVPVSAVCAVLLALLAGLGAALYGLRSAGIERERAMVEAQRAERVAAFLESILASVDPSVAGDLDKTLMQQVLGSAVERAEAELADDPQMLAEMESVIGRSYRGLGDPQTALRLLSQARERQSPARARTIDDLAMAMDDLGLSKEAVALLDEYLAQAGPADPDELSDRLELQISRAEYLLRAEGPAAGLTAAERLLEPVQAHFGADHKRTLELRAVHARGLSQTGELARAVSVLEDVTERQLRSLGPSASATLHVQGALAIAYLQSRRFDDALRLVEEIMPRARKVYGERHQANLSLYSLQGSALKGLDRMADAAEAFAQAYHGFLDKFGERHPHVVGTAFNYAQALIAAQEFERAEQLLSKAAGDAPAVFGPEHPLVQEIALAQAKLALATGQSVQAETALLAIQQQVSDRIGSDHPVAVEARQLLVELYQATNRPEQARRWQGKATDQPQ